MHGVPEYIGLCDGIGLQNANCVSKEKLLCESVLSHAIWSIVCLSVQCCV